MPSLSDELYALLKHADKDFVKVRHDHMAYLHKAAIALESDLKKIADDLKRSTSSVNAVIATLRRMIEDGNPDVFKRALMTLWANELDSDSSR